MVFLAKVYRLGKSGRLAIMLPKDIIAEVGEWEVELREKQGTEAPVEPSATPLGEGGAVTPEIIETPVQVSQSQI